MNTANTTSEFQFDVFLSHSAKDKAVVRPLAERLPRVRKGGVVVRASSVKSEDRPRHDAPEVQLPVAAG